MKDVLISIQPQWCQLIASGKKTIEIRKTKPNLETPFRCYIYCTNTKPFLVWGDVFRGNWETEFTAISGYSRKAAEKIWDVFNGNVIGEFICEKIDEYVYAYCTHPEIGMDYDCGDNWWEMDDEDLKRACLTETEFRYYASGNQLMYGWHISNLQIYDEPKPLSSFSAINKVAVKKCEHRERVYNNPDLTNGAWLQGSYVCNKGEIDWCSQCKTKPIIRPPQSWCYIESVGV